MAQRGRPTKKKLEVTQAQVAELEELVRQRTSRAITFRSKIILKCASGMKNSAVAGVLRTTPFTVGFWRNHFIKGGIDALLDEPRPGAPRKIGDDKVESLVKATLEAMTEGATHWSTRMMAEKLGLSQSAVSRVWRGFVLAPHRSETFQISSDPFFIEKVRDVVGLYMSPPTNPSPKKIKLTMFGWRGFEPRHALPKKYDAAERQWCALNSTLPDRRIAGAKQLETLFNKG